MDDKNRYYVVIIDMWDIYTVSMYGSNKLKISNGARWVTISSPNICNECDIVSEIVKAFNLPYIRRLKQRSIIWEVHNNEKT